MAVQTGQHQRLVRRVKKLTSEVIDLVERNKRNPQEVAEVLQEIIDDPSRNPIPGPLSRKDYQALVRSWEVHFPGQGRQVVDLLAPLYSPQLSFQLRPAMAELEERVKKAVFWVKVPVIEPVYLDSDEITLDRLEPEDIERSLRRYFDTEGPLPNDRMEAVYEVTYKALWNRVYRKVERDFTRFDEFLMSSILQVAQYAAACVIARKTDVDFRPLIELYTTGNLPYEFENNGTLYVLCAKEE